MNKLFFHISFLALFLFLSSNVFADSSLTSISFWDISESSLVQKTGRLNGKKKLNKVRFKFLSNSKTTVFDKIALVNAMGWDSNSKVKNSEIFLSKLKKEYLNFVRKYRKQLLKAQPISQPINLNKIKLDENGNIIRNKKNDKHFIQGVFYESVYDFDYKYVAVESLLTPEDIVRAYSDYRGFGFSENYIVYLYLLAMDNYWDVSFVSEVLVKLNNEELLYNLTLEIDEKGIFHTDVTEVFDFIKMLVSTQFMSLSKGIKCEIFEEFNSLSYRTRLNSCFSNLSIRKSLSKSYDYLKIYSGKCDRIFYDTDSYCNRKVIYAKQNQEVRICHNPIFIYGNLNVYDQSNNEVFKFIIDGGDCVYLDVSTYPIGSYRIQMINTETDPKTPYNLELIIY